MSLGEGLDAPELAHALKLSGLCVIEVTLRTPFAHIYIEEMKKAEPTLIIGAGTVMSPPDVTIAIDVGSDFIVTPGLTNELISPLITCDLPVFPGVATASEAMSAFYSGFKYQKFFPAQASGGVEFLKSISGPLPQITFMPTGGISKINAGNYLALKNVVGIGGSWIVDTHHIQSQSWEKLINRVKIHTEFFSNHE